MKINRLLEMTMLLMNRGSVTAREMADRFGVSTRTIYRDVDDLSGAGVPVYTCKGTNGGIYLMEDYALNKTIVNEYEADSLMLALKTMQVTKFPDLDATLDKLGALFRKNSRIDWVHIDFSPWGSEPNEGNRFLNIKMAILDRRAVSFDYLNSQGEKSNRLVEPLQLIYKGQAWYLRGWCRSRIAFRLFRISRIKNLIVTDMSFNIRDTGFLAQDEASGAMSGFCSIKAKLRFMPEVMHRVYDDYDEEKIHKNEDGTCDVTAEYPEDEWVYGYILSFGSSVRVLSPESLKKIISDKLKDAMKYYL